MSLNHFVAGRYARLGVLVDGTRVRLAVMSESDLDAVCQFLRESPGAYTRLIEPDGAMCETNQDGDHTMATEEVFPLLAWQGNKVIGEGLLYVSQRPGPGCGRIVIVEHSVFRGKGVAKLLLEGLMESALAGDLTQRGHNVWCNLESCIGRA